MRRPPAKANDKLKFVGRWALVFAPNKKDLLRVAISAAAKGLDLSALSGLC
jgi:hypothetical protein